jgi:hypothetical protein
MSTRLTHGARARRRAMTRRLAGSSLLSPSSSSSSSSSSFSPLLSSSSSSSSSPSSPSSPLSFLLCSLGGVLRAGRLRLAAGVVAGDDCATLASRPPPLPGTRTAHALPRACEAEPLDGLLDDIAVSHAQALKRSSRRQLRSGLARRSSTLVTTATVRNSGERSPRAKSECTTPQFDSTHPTLPAQPRVPRGLRRRPRVTVPCSRDPDLAQSGASNPTTTCFTPHGTAARSKQLFFAICLKKGV